MTPPWWGPRVWVVHRDEKMRERKNYMYKKWMDEKHNDVSAASGLLGKPGTYQKSPGSWALRYPLPKTEKSSDLAHYFSGVVTFCVQKNQTSNLRGSMSGLNQVFTGEIPQ